MSRQKEGVRLNATDFYPTPPWCYENLDIDWSQFTSAHEPCRGDSRIYTFLQEKGIDTTWSEITEGKDFFEHKDSVDLIFTNPPFKIAQEFIDHAFSLAPTVVMLLRINFLGSIKRQAWWKDNPPTAMYVLSKRPSFTGDGTDATEYCWVCWDSTNRIPSGFHWVDNPTTAQNTHAQKLAREALARFNEKRAELIEMGILEDKKKK